MNQYRYAAFVVLIMSFFTISAYAQNNPLSELAWQVGPTQGSIGDIAKIRIPVGYVFLGSSDTKKLMEMMENIPSENQYVFAPEDLSWFSVFEFSEVGYVKDNETLDPQSVLDSVTKGTEQGNIERRRRGWSTLSILGWRFEPRYDQQANLLEWALLAKDDSSNSQIINYNTHLLGRTNVMNVILVADPSVLDTSVIAFKEAIRGYSFVPGETYAEYRKGDRVAEFGLAALIAGGAAAVATKKGVWAVLAGFFAAAWKFVAVAVVGLFAWLGSLFRSKS